MSKGTRQWLMILGAIALTAFVLVRASLPDMSDENKRTKELGNEQRRQMRRQYGQPEPVEVRVVD